MGSIKHIIHFFILCNVDQDLDRKFVIGHYMYRYLHMLHGVQYSSIY